MSDQETEPYSKSKKRKEKVKAEDFIKRLYDEANERVKLENS